MCGNPALKEPFTHLLENLDVLEGSTHNQTFELCDWGLKTSNRPTAVK